MNKSKDVKKENNPNRPNGPKQVKVEKKSAGLGSKIEKSGYKWANRLHKFSVFSIVAFIIYNFYIFGKEYNSHWRARRVINFKINNTLI